MRAAICFLMCIVSIIFGCKNTSKHSSSKKANTTQEVIVQRDFSPEGKIAPVEISAVKFISKDIIEITFKSGNACLEDFKLYSAGGIIKTNPPKIPVFLYAEKSNCKKSGTGSSQFNISSAIPADIKDFVLLINNDFSVNSSNPD
jgi:hypothetical protein